MPAWKVIEVMEFYIKADMRTGLLALNSRWFLFFFGRLFFCTVSPFWFASISSQQWKKKFIHLSNESAESERERGVDLLSRIGSLGVWECCFLSVCMRVCVCVCMCACVCVDLYWGVNLQSCSPSSSEAPQACTEEILCGGATNWDPHQ